MTIAETILAEFEAQAPLTRRHLERVPEDKLDWKPAEKSMTLGQLALHIAQTPGGVAEFIGLDALELPDFEFPHPASRDEVLRAYDESVENARIGLSGLSDEVMEGSIAFQKDGETLMQFPRKGFARDIILNHTYHHRGQISVYLRLLGVPVPSSFGPTADEPMGMPEMASA